MFDPWLRQKRHDAGRHGSSSAIDVKDGRDGRNHDKLHPHKLKIHCKTLCARPFLRSKIEGTATLPLLQSAAMSRHLQPPQSTHSTITIHIDSPKMDVNLDFLMETLHAMPSETQSMLCMALLNNVIPMDFKERVMALRNGDKVSELAATADLTVPSLSVSLHSDDMETETVYGTPSLRIPGLARRSLSVSSSVSNISDSTYLEMDTSSGQTTRCNSPIPASPIPAPATLNRLEFAAPKLSQIVYFKSIHRLFLRLTDRDRVRKQLGITQHLPVILLGLQLLSTQTLDPLVSTWKHVMDQESIETILYIHEHTLLHYLVAAVCLANKFINDHACNTKFFSSFTGLIGKDLCFAERRLLASSDFGTAIPSYQNLLSPASNSWSHAVQAVFLLHSRLNYLGQFKQFLGQLDMFAKEIKRLDDFAGRLDGSYVAARKAEIKSVLLTTAEGVVRSL